MGSVASVKNGPQKKGKRFGKLRKRLQSSRSAPAIIQPQTERSDDTTADRSKSTENKRTAVLTGTFMEEYQTLADEAPEIVYGQVSQNLARHPLLKGKFCLVRDNESEVDHLQSTEPSESLLVATTLLPRSDFPIVGTAQLSMNALRTLLRRCNASCLKNWLILNVRNDPCLFVKIQDDWIPYTLRNIENIQTPIGCSQRTSTELDLLEAECREEVLKYLKALRQEKFYFYDDITFFENQPVMHVANQPDYLLLTEEVYTNLTLSNGDVRYLRLKFPPMCFPLEEEVDGFLQLLKDMVSEMLSQRTSSIEGEATDNLFGFIISGHGIRDGSIQLGMVMAYLTFMHLSAYVQSVASNSNSIKSSKFELHKLLINQPNKNQCINGTSGNLKQTSTRNVTLSQLYQNIKVGKFQFVRQVGRHLPYMVQIKEEVDRAIDQCGETINLREAILESVMEFETELFSKDMDQAIKSRRCLENIIYQLERYYMLICFNAYLREQVPCQFGLNFTKWMRRRPKLYQILEFLDVSEWYFTVELLKQSRRFLVADTTHLFDDLCTWKSTGISNFRQLMGWPIYGASQPNAGSLRHVQTMVASAYWNVALNGMRVDETASRSVVEEARRVPIAMPSVVWVSMRNEYVISCGEETYTWREKDKYDTPVTMKGVSNKEMEDFEEKFAEGIRKLAVPCRPLFFDLDQGIYKQGDILPHGEVLSTKSMFQRMFNPDTDPEITESPPSGVPDSYWEYVRKHAEYHRIPINSSGPPPSALFDQILRLVVTNARGLLTSSITAQSLVNASAGMGRRHAYMRRQTAASEEMKDWHLPSSNNYSVDRIAATNLIFFCGNGRERTSLAMCVAGLVYCHLLGFSYGYRVEEEERISLRDAKYTKGEYEVIQRFVRRIPNGNQVKREVDYVLDRCFDSMSMMHFHIREEIYFTYAKSRDEKNKSKSDELRRKSLAYLEEYFFLILFNLYLHSCKAKRWKQPFEAWMEKTTKKWDFMEILDNFGFFEFDNQPGLRRIRERWRPNVSSFSQTFHIP